MQSAAAGKPLIPSFLALCRHPGSCPRYQLGCAQARCGRAAAAVASFRRACSTMPGHPVFLHELAKACQVRAAQRML